jgi:glucose-6-phosphate dehydrogenase assembly protein OpcA
MTADDLPVNANTIEKRLADLWREEQGDEHEHAVTRAALWNVVAHTWTFEQHTHATDVLARASASVPQRAIVIRADPRAGDELSSWISTNCHLVGDGRQVCSEEVSIVAAGERIHHVPPLVESLLLPDMPVAVWWLGDLPGDHHAYAETLLDPADRLIVDSSHFKAATDLDLVCRIAEETITAPADLNWARLEEWRAATAAVFDPPAMRERLHAIRTVRVFIGDGTSFGSRSDALLYVSWLTTQIGADIAFDFVREGASSGMNGVEIHFTDSSIALIRGDHDRGVVVANSDGTETAVDCVTRSLAHDEENLIVRLLLRPEADRVYLKVLRAARRIAPRLS